MYIKLPDNKNTTAKAELTSTHKFEGNQTHINYRFLCDALETNPKDQRSSDTKSRSKVANCSILAFGQMVHSATPQQKEGLRPTVAVCDNMTTSAHIPQVKFDISQPRCLTSVNTRDIEANGRELLNPDPDSKPLNCCDPCVCPIW